MDETQWFFPTSSIGDKLLPITAFLQDAGTPLPGGGVDGVQPRSQLGDSRQLFCPPEALLPPRGGGPFPPPSKNIRAQ